MRRAALVLALTLFGTLPARPASADTAAAASSPAVVESLPVTFALENTTLTSEALRVAIEQELRVRVSTVDILESTGLSIRIQHRRAKVSFTTDKGETISRTVELSGDDARSSEIVALLAGNLARDQASELLARLTPIEPEQPAAEAAPEPEPEAAAPAPPPAKEPEQIRMKERKKGARADDFLIRDAFNLSLYHPVTLRSETERRLFNLELGAAYSRVGAIDGFGLTLGYLRVLHQLNGTGIALGLVRVDGNVKGAQIAGLVSEGHGRLNGWEGAAVMTLRWGDVEGAQTAALLTTARNVEGFQSAAAVSVAQDVHGVQAAPVVIGRDFDGAQLGVVSVARDISGVQLGVVNVARRVGVQIGIVNVVERVDDAALGLVTIAGNGRIQPAVWGTHDSDPAANAGVRFVAGYAFSQLGGGMYQNGKDARSEAGGGFHLPWGSVEDKSPFGDGFFEIGAHSSSRYQTTGAQQHRLHYRAGLGLRLLGPLSLLAGVEVNHDMVDFGADPRAPRPAVGLTLF